MCCPPSTLYCDAPRGTVMISPSRHDSAVMFSPALRSRPPRGAFSEIKPEFSIHMGDVEKLPTAHTCINRLVLPGPGVQKVELYRRLQLVLQEGHEFRFS